MSVICTNSQLVLAVYALLRVGQVLDLFLMEQINPRRRFNEKKSYIYSIEAYSSAVADNIKAML